MGKPHNSGLRWKKNNSIVTYVLPNSEVQPEIIGERDSSPIFVSVHRVHEPFIRHIFGDSEIVDLRRVLTGNDIAQYEAWKAPHLPPIDRHTKYVFKDADGKRVSAPLYVCAPVQVTLEMKSDTSAKLGAISLGGAKSSLGRGRTYNVQVSAATDPEIHLAVTTPYQNDEKEDIVELVRAYAYELHQGIEASSSDMQLGPEAVFEKLLKKHKEYIEGSGEILVKVLEEMIHLDEGETLNVPLSFYPQTPGKMLLIIAARDQKGDRVFSDFIGLSYSRPRGLRRGRLTRDF